MYAENKNYFMVFYHITWTKQKLLHYFLQIERIVIKARWRMEFLLVNATLKFSTLVFFSNIFSIYMHKTKATSNYYGVQFYDNKQP